MSFRIGRTLPPAAAPIYPEDIVSGITGQFRGRKTVTKFEEELKTYYRVGYCFTLSSGKAALTVILHALKELYPARDEVLIPAFTCYSVPSAIVRAGLKVRLCDLKPDSFDFDYGQISTIVSACRDRLLCVVPVHLFGIPVDIERLRNIIGDDNIFIVEDAAQAMGGESQGRKLGTIGDVGFFSLGRGKALSTVEGGIVLTSRKGIAENIARVMETIPDYTLFEVIVIFLYALSLLFLLRPSLFWIPKALPFLRLGETIYDPHFKMRKISPFQAGLAGEWERKLHKFKSARLKNLDELLNRLENDGIKASWTDRRPLPFPIRFPLKVENVKKGENILRNSDQMGLGISRTYPDSVDVIRDLNFNSSVNDFPQAKDYARRLLTIPVHPYITNKDRENIVKLFKLIDT